MYRRWSNSASAECRPFCKVRSFSGTVSTRNKQSAVCIWIQWLRGIPRKYWTDSNFFWPKFYRKKDSKYCFQQKIYIFSSTSMNNFQASGAVSRLPDTKASSSINGISFIMIQSGTRSPILQPSSKNTLHCQHVWDGVSQCPYLAAKNTLHCQHVWDGIS